MKVYVKTDIVECGVYRWAFAGNSQADVDYLVEGGLVEGQDFVVEA